MSVHAGLNNLVASSRILGVDLPFFCRSFIIRHTLPRTTASKHGRQHVSSSSLAASNENRPAIAVDVNQYDQLDPRPPDYSFTPFIDSCRLTIVSGAGGHGCVSFLREKYIAHGPPNGGDGGTGGNVYIQAVKGETSLHKIARGTVLRAGRGKNGQGGLQGGKRGEDILLVVPVGTVVRETSRVDPVAEQLAQRQHGISGVANEDSDTAAEEQDWRKRWLLYPGTLPDSFTAEHIPKAPSPRQSNLAMIAPQAPIRLDLDRPMAAPMLLAAGAVGGLGNPHFVTKSVTRPKYATKGLDGVAIKLQLELKLLADVGLVGLPNAGKSTLLRALTASRARVGNWAFTTLAPNIGTVVLDSSGPAGRVRQLRDASTGELRTHFTIADIPGLIEGAHLDKGLGLDFLRHIERARALAFVIDLSAGDPVETLKGLWLELQQYQALESDSINGQDQAQLKSYNPEPWSTNEEEAELPLLDMPAISSKPWLVVATKADLDDTQDSFRKLQYYLGRVSTGNEPHPSDKQDAWSGDVIAIPVSAMHKENTGTVIDQLVKLVGQP